MRKVGSVHILRNQLLPNSGPPNSSLRNQDDYNPEGPPWKRLYNMWTETTATTYAIDNVSKKKLEENPY